MANASATATNTTTATLIITTTAAAAPAADTATAAAKQAALYYMSLNIITNTILGAPYFNYSIKGPKTILIITARPYIILSILHVHGPRLTVKTEILQAVAAVGHECSTAKKEENT